VSLLLGFFVKEILGEIIWIAVLLSPIVEIVFAAWIGKGPHRRIHPIWPVRAYVFLAAGHRQIQTESLHAA
jgi:hypothetical protein